MIQTGKVDPSIKALQDQIHRESTNYLQAVVVNKDYVKAKQTKEKINILQKELNKFFSYSQYAVA